MVTNVMRSRVALGHWAGREKLPIDLWSWGMSRGRCCRTGSKYVRRVNREDGSMAVVARTAPNV